MKLQDLRQPDTFQHLLKYAKAVKADLTQRARRIDIRALAAEWAVVGVDISYWQSDIDFSILASKVDFVFVRAGYGNDYIDPRLTEYIQGCKEYDIPFGIYWYTKPDKDWKKHADNFYFRWLADPGELYPVFDLEETGGKNKADLAGWYEKLYTNVPFGFTYKTGLDLEEIATYTSPGFLNRAIGLTQFLKRTRLWVANWTTLPAPTIPNEWLIPNKTWKFWQWSSTGRGKDYGVSSTYIDLDRYNGSKAQFYAEFGITPPPQETDMKYKVNVAVKIRREPDVTSEQVGSRAVGEIVTPVDTIADKTHVNSYWVEDGKGWSAAQWGGDEYMEPYV